MTEFTRKLSSAFIVFNPSRGGRSNAKSLDKMQQNVSHWNENMQIAKNLSTQRINLTKK